jgi:N6-adenosine-specific RNA methylase IME4
MNVRKCKSCGGPISWQSGNCTRCGKPGEPVELPPPDDAPCFDDDNVPALPTLPPLPPLDPVAATVKAIMQLDPKPTTITIAPITSGGLLPPLPPLTFKPTLETRVFQAVDRVVSSLPIVAPQMIPARILVADPPWKFGDKLPGGGRGAEKHYSVLTLDEIKAFPLPPLLDNSILFLWRVGAMVEEAYAVARAWGFVPKSELTWQKVRSCKDCKGNGYMEHGGLQKWCVACKGRGRVVLAGMGRYTRRATETAIIAVRGKPSECMPEAKDQIDTFEAPRGQHSEKPDRFFEIIERMYPSGPYVELFARKRRPGWIQYGDELPAEEGIKCLHE